MPTVTRFQGFRVVVYPNDHRPPHVRVMNAEGEAIFLLNCPDGPPALRGSFGLTAPALNIIETALTSVVRELCVVWERVHGNQ